MVVHGATGVFLFFWMQVRTARLFQSTMEPLFDEAFQRVRALGFAHQLFCPTTVQLHGTAFEGTRLEVAFDAWEETKRWTGPTWPDMAVFRVAHDPPPVRPVPGIVVSGEVL